MAVDARHLRLFQSQLLGSRGVMNSIDVNSDMYGAPMGFGGVPPLSGTTTENFLPVYGSGITDSVQTHQQMKADSGLTYNLPVSRKRTRDSINPLLLFQNNQNLINDRVNCSGSFTFLGEDLSVQIQHQQFEIDHFIAQHTEKVRLEVEERRKRNSRRLIAAVEEGIVKRLRAKEEEIDKIGKLNWALQEKVKNLCIENQIWQDLAQTNEATANALRTNLEQVLAHVQDDQLHRPGDNEAAALMDDAQSCCDSNHEADGEKHVVLENGSEENFEMHYNDNDGATRGSKKMMNNSNNNRLCRNCGKSESCVLLLPCRHLCLCTVCGSSLHTCPICKSTKNASVHVNLS